MANALGQLWINLGLKSTVSQDASGVTSELDKIDKKATGLQSNFAAAGKSMTSAGTAMSAGITLPLVAIGAGIGIVTDKATTFDTGMRRVATMLPGITDASFSQISQQALTLSKDFGSSTTDMTNAMYQALSSNVPKDNIFAFMQDAEKLAIGGATDVVTATDVLTDSVNSYGAANLSTAQASDILFQGTKFGKSTVEQLKASLSNVVPVAASLGVGFADVNASLATMTIQGTPTAQATTQLRAIMDELSNPTTNAAAAFKYLSGKSFPEFIAAGGNMGQAVKVLQDGLGKTVPDMDKVSSAMKKMEDPSSALAQQFNKLTGESIQQFVASGKDVVPVLAQMGIETGTTTTALKDYFGRMEAGTGAIQLSTNDGKLYAESMKGMGVAAGSTEEAYKTMSEGVGAASDRMKSAFDVLLIKLGDDFLPIISDTVIPILNDFMGILDTASPYIKMLADGFNALPGPVKLGVLAVVALLAALGPVLVIAGALASGIAAVSALLGVAFVGSILAVLGPIALVVGAAFLLYEAITNWDALVSIVGSVMTSIQDYVSETVTKIVDFFTSIDYVKLGEDAMNMILDGIQTYGPKLIDAAWLIFVEIPKKIATIDWYTVGVTVLTSLRDGMNFVMGALAGFLIGALGVIATRLASTSWGAAGIAIWNSFTEGIKGVLQGPYTAITGAITAIKTFLSGINISAQGSGIWNTLLAGIRTVLQGPYNLILGAINAIRAFLTGTNYSAQGSGIWNTLLAGIRSVLQGPYNLIMGAITAIRTFLSGISFNSQGTSIWNTVLAGIRSVLQGPYNAITGAIGTIRTYLSGINLSSVGSGIIDTLRSGIVSAFNTLLSTIRGYVGDIESIVSTARSAYDKIVGYVSGSSSAASTVSNNVSKAQTDYSRLSIIPASSGGKGPLVTNFATGGIISSPILAQIGEAGTEAIIPLDRFADIVNIKGLIGDALGSHPPSSYKSVKSEATTYAGDTITINIGTINKQADVDYLMKQIEIKQKAKGFQRGAFA